jgi:hypothetical protein
VKNVLSVDYSLFIGLLSSTLSKLIEIGEQGQRLSGSSRDEAVSLIQELKSKGFKNREIAVLTGRRWSEATVKKYTKGVKILSTVEREKVLETFSMFAREGKTIQEVEDYLEIDKYLNSINQNFEAIGNLIIKTRGTGVFELFLDLSKQIGMTAYNVQDISKGLDLLKKMHEKGITDKTIFDLDRSLGNFGGLSNFLKTIEKYQTLQKIEQDITEVKNELAQKNHKYRLLEIKIKDLKIESQMFSSLLRFTKALIEDHNFDLISTKTLFEIAEKYGSPAEILEAILCYQKIQELQKQRETVKSEINILKDERIKKEANLEALENFIEKANRSIGMIEASHSKSFTIQSIADLIYETGESIDPVHFKKILILFLIGAQGYIIKRGPIPGCDPLVENNVSILINYFKTKI